MYRYNKDFLSGPKPTSFELFQRVRKEIALNIIN